MLIYCKNQYNIVKLKNKIIIKTSCQSRFNARYWMLGAGALGRPSGMVWGVRREEGSHKRSFTIQKKCSRNFLCGHH